MALTIWQVPEAWTPAFNDQWLTLDSTQVAQPGFYCLVTTEIIHDVNGTPTTATFTDKIFPRPSDNYIVYNPKEKVQNYVQNFFKPYDFTIVEAVNERVQVTVTFREVWTDEVEPDDANYTYYAWNACLTEEAFYGYVESRYISTDTKIRVHSVATSGTDSLPFEIQTMGADVYMHFVKPAALDAINYKLIDTNGIDILDAMNLTGSMTTEQIYQINISPQLAVNEGWNPTVGMFIQIDFLDADVDNIYSYTYEIKSLCTKHDVLRVYYRNRRGGVSSFPFEQMSVNTIDSKTNEVRLNRNKIIDSQFKYLPYDHENRIVSTQERYSISLMTNWITQKESEYLEELYSSPQVWVVNESKGYTSNPYFYVPVTKRSAPYLLQKHSNNKLFNYKIEVELSTQETRQRT